MVSLPFDVNIGAAVLKFAYYTGYIFLGLAVVAVLGAIWYLTSFPIRVTIFPLYGGGNEGSYSFGKPKKNSIKWVRGRTAWKKMWPLLNREELEPFDSSLIYPGNRIYVFEINDKWVPAKLQLNSESETKDGKTIYGSADIKPVPYYIRNWQSLQHKKHAAEFAMNDWWNDNKHLIFMIVTMAICLGMVLVTVWLTYKWVAPGRQDWAMIGQYINNLNSVQGVAP